MRNVTKTTELQTFLKFVQILQSQTLNGSTSLSKDETLNIAVHLFVTLIQNDQERPGRQGNYG